MNNHRQNGLLKRDLVWTFISCWCCALVMFALSASTFVKKSGYVINSETVPIATYNSVLSWALFMTIELALMQGVAFLGFGFMVWKAYRQIKAAATAALRSAG